eukprot:129733-Pleurochrysis_carterae.AAC.1
MCAAAVPHPRQGWRRQLDRPTPDGARRLCSPLLGSAKSSLARIHRLRARTHGLDTRARKDSARVHA